ncbi:MAG: TPM domain-containing protein, partial [Betaproteobacteria bacterium]
MSRAIAVAVRRRRLQIGFLVLVVLGAIGAIGAHAADVPFLSGRVVDNAEILDAATRATVTEKLRAHEDRTGNQIAVLTVPTIGSDSIEEFSTRVFESWKLGRKGKDNGVLVVVAPKDRKMRIEVGYGLEGTLTDVAASRIIRNVMTPAFKANDFGKGVSAGVDAIIGQLDGTSDIRTLADVAPPSAQSSSNGFPMAINDPGLPPWPMRILLGCFIFGIIGLFTLIGVVTPGAGWFLYLFLIPFWAMFPIIILGVRGALILLGVYVVGFPLAKLILSRTDWYAKARRELKTKGTTTLGGISMGVGSGSGGGWSSGSGGG